MQSGKFCRFVFRPVYSQLRRSVWSTFWQCVLRPLLLSFFGWRFPSFRARQRNASKLIIVLSWSAPLQVLRTWTVEAIKPKQACLCRPPALTGSEGKLTNWYQRAGVVTAINALVAAPGSAKSVAPLAAKVSSYLMTFYKSEGEAFESSVAFWPEPLV